MGVLTLPRGDKELGGTVTLGDNTTYEVVISRSLTNTGEPFVFQDTIYGARQSDSSADSYYFMRDFTISQVVGDNGVSTSAAFIYHFSSVLGYHWRLISARGWLAQ